MTMGTPTPPSGRTDPSLGFAKILRWDKLELDCTSYEVCWDGQPVKLTPAELYILKYLMEHQHSLVTHQDIAENVKDRNLQPFWSGERSRPSRYTVRTHINNLRKHLRAASVPNPVVTVRGIGYRLSRLNHPLEVSGTN